MTPDYDLEVYVNNEQVLTRRVTADEAARGEAFVIERGRRGRGQQSSARR
ncbi:MAG: hypothetical protein WKF30_08715 [Pyrinomonadaceae bacterium]